MEIGLVSCTNQKKQGRHKAKNLYNSPLFNKTFKYAEKNFDKTLILSAKHYVIQPNEKLKHYNTSLDDKTKEERKEWTQIIAKTLNGLYTEQDKLYFLAGKKYYKKVLDHLEIPYEILMEGKRIGERLNWLNNRL